MPKISICKIHMIGSPALVLGLGRKFEEGDEHWERYQLFTLEDYVGVEHINQETVQANKKFWGKEIHFFSINKSFPIKQFNHGFNFKENQEISMEEFASIRQELNSQGWSEFDLETWGK